MKSFPRILGQPVLLAAGLGLILILQTAWSATVGRGAAPVVGRGGAAPAITRGSRNGALGRGGAVAVGYGNSLGIGLGGITFGTPTVVNYNPGYAPAVTPRAGNGNLYYALLRRSLRGRFGPGSAPFGTGFNANLFTGSWPTGPYRNFFWNQNSIGEAYANLNYFRLGVNNLVTSYPLSPYYLSPDYFNLHPLVYFANPRNFALAEPQARALRDQLRNGGILLFDDHWGNRDRLHYYTEIRRIFTNYSLVELPVDRAFNPSFYAVQVKPQPQYFAGVRQSAFTIVNQTPAEERVTNENGTFSGYFGSDGQVIILAN